MKQQFLKLIDPTFFKNCLRNLAGNVNPGVHRRTQQPVGRGQAARLQFR
jgi:hypothetical protein